MTLYKVSRTARSRHIGMLHYDLINAKYAKEVAGANYHIYAKEPMSITGKSKWNLVMR